MTFAQATSILGAVLAVLIGAGGIYLGWFGAGDGMGLIFAGLSILGVHATFNVPTA